MLKTITTIFLLLILNGCVQNAALLGPALTGATTGNVLQSGLSYHYNLSQNTNRKFNKFFRD